MMELLDTPHQSSRGGYGPEAIVIHIFAGTYDGTVAWIQDPRSKVSYHYGLAIDGRKAMFVPPARRAWHAGSVVDPTAAILERHPGVNPNRFTIGIGHEGQGVEAWTQAMWENSVMLVANQCRTWGIPPNRDRIVMHREIRGDKSCPGTWFADRVDEYVEQVVEQLR